MFKLLVLSTILLASLLSSVSSTAAEGKDCDISGIWDHSAKAATLFIDLTKGEILVHSHEITPKSIGLVVLKNLELDSTESYWNAKMYSAADESFVEVKITVISCYQLSVSFKDEVVLGLIRMKASK